MDFSRTWVEIDKSALLSNVRELRSILSPKTKFLAVVKANAYGHGLAGVTRVLAPHVDWFGVDNAEEALVLKRLGFKRPILLLSGGISSEAAVIVANGFRSSLSDADGVYAFNREADRAGVSIPVHVKIDTGMGRQGALPDTLQKLKAALHASPNLHFEGVMTHLADADHIKDASFTQVQLKRFRESLVFFRRQKLKPPLVHACASAGALRFPEAHFDLVRFGIALYGIWPTSHFSETLAREKKSVALTPVLSWRAAVLQVKRIPKGTSVGYGHAETVRKSSRIATLPIGYADGYDRRLSFQGAVLISGRRAKVLGRVSMSLTTVDVTDIPEAHVGSAATLIGRDGDNAITVSELADRMETIPYEVVARINPRIPRVFI